MERKEYEAPKVTRIEIGFEDRIIVAGCNKEPRECSTPAYLS